MYEVVGVKFRDTGKIYYFTCAGLELQQGDKCVVETEEGLAFGEVITEIKMLPKNETQEHPRKVIRKATRSDFNQAAKNEEKEQSSFNICINKIKDRELSIKLVGVQYSFDGRKAVFYFTAEGRIDFRELVKDLAHILKVRIELRQIGVRDETKIIGGLGPCGRETCCSTFLGDFEPVTIKMAKEQNIILNPAKTSGLCGRLMCCLMYEHSFYHESMKKYPKLGSKVSTNSGTGKVLDINVFSEKITIEFEDGKRASLKLPDIKFAHSLKIAKENESENKELTEKELKEITDNEKN